MTRMVPYLTVHDGAAAIEFYAAAFGAKETGERYDEADGRIGFVALEIDGEPLYLSDENHQYGAYAPGRSATARRLSCSTWTTPTRPTLARSLRAGRWTGSPATRGTSGAAGCSTRSGTTGRSARRSAERWVPRWTTTARPGGSGTSRTRPG